MHHITMFFFHHPLVKKPRNLSTTKTLSLYRTRALSRGVRTDKANSVNYMIATDVSL